MRLRAGEKRAADDADYTDEDIQSASSAANTLFGLARHLLSVGTLVFSLVAARF